VTGRRCTAVATALLLAALLATAGCGLGPGEEVGSVELTVTRDFGAEPMVERTLEARESDTVMRVLEGAAEIETRYGGGYVSAIDGVAEGRSGGRPHDWFYFVDGVEAPIGAAERSLRGGERIWWDHRDWSASNRVPAVVGSWPAPFSDGYEGRWRPVAVVCEGGGDACEEVRAALAAEGVEVAAAAPKGAIRVLVGPWARLRDDPAAAQIESGPQESGVYAVFGAAAGGYELRGLDAGGEEARRFGPAAGLVAATRRLEAPPTWVVTGAGAAGVRAAAELLGEGSLRDHYAVVTEDGREEPLPLR
jgi:hypothetical protein